MLFWVAAACLMLVAVLAVLAPLSGGVRLFTTARGRDTEVYRDQLAELDWDAARGLIAPAEAAESACRDRAAPSSQRRRGRRFPHI